MLETFPMSTPNLGACHHLALQHAEDIHMKRVANLDTILSSSKGLGMIVVVEYCLSKGVETEPPML